MTSLPPSPPPSPTPSTEDHNTLPAPPPSIDEQNTEAYIQNEPEGFLIGSRLYGYYGNDVRTWRPVDGIQQDFLSTLHDGFKDLNDGKPFLAPLGDSAGNILDVWTGPGVWAKEVAAMRPQATVYGNHEWPMQSPAGPTNYVARTLDPDGIELWPEDAYIFVHIQEPPGTLSNGLLRKAYQALRKGGWIELSFLAPRGVEGGAWADWAREHKEALSHVSSCWSPTMVSASTVVQSLNEVGFTTVHAKEQTASFFNASNYDLEGQVMYCLVMLRGWFMDRAIIQAMLMRWEFPEMVLYSFWAQK